VSGAPASCRLEREEKTGGALSLNLDPNIAPGFLAPDNVVLQQALSLDHQTRAAMLARGSSAIAIRSSTGGRSLMRRRTRHFASELMLRLRRTGYCNADLVRVISNPPS